MVLNLLLRRFFWCTITPLCLWFLWFVLVPQNVSRDDTTDAYFAGIFDTAVELNRSSLTAILPVTPESIESLAERLMPLYEAESCLYEIVVESPQSLALRIKEVVHALVLRSSGHNHPVVSIHFYSSTRQADFGHYASKVSTDWVLVLDEHGLYGIDAPTRHRLLNPVALPIPFGICGIATNGTCISSSNSPRPASYLVPPFVTQTVLLQSGECIDSLVSSVVVKKPCGVILSQPSQPSRLMTRCSCLDDTMVEERQKPSVQTASKHSVVAPRDSPAQFIILVPTWHDLQSLSPLLCHLQSQGFIITNLVYIDKGETYGNLRSMGCSLLYHTVTGHNDEERFGRLVQKLHVLQKIADVVIVPKGEFPLSLKAQQPGQTIVEIPRAEFRYSQWMCSLTLQEWRHWNIPRVDITIITQNRPWSLNRLLSSLSRSLLFGDKVDLRINLEQDSDEETMRLVDSFNWNHGAVTVYHRIIRGGLLPAIVESWYPHANHTYALLLEDDVELSPLFYAWAKMSILRYRYGDHKNQSPLLFGISLYQQKNVELPIDGRRHFDARTIFQEQLLNPSTPYLSPVPCSWGAIYFPEHWREFHDYITIRLSALSLDIEQWIVPNVRSNNWTKSWKKYFIELVFLRGYVMLYPNFDNYSSLSTNHLEVGSHVKHRTKEKQDMFLLPLMDLPHSTSEEVAILNLPNKTLPFFHNLPVFNLTGGTSQLDTLVSDGISRRMELLDCIDKYPIPFSARSLMCILS